VTDPVAAGDATETVRGILIPRLASVLGVKDSMVTDDLELATLGLSSLEVMEMVYDAEDQLEVVFREEALAEVTTVGALVGALAAEVDRPGA
jgi:acyl carrier protein